MDAAEVAPPREAAEGNLSWFRIPFQSFPTEMPTTWSNKRTLDRVRGGNIEELHRFIWDRRRHEIHSQLSCSRFHFRRQHCQQCWQNLSMFVLTSLPATISILQRFGDVSRPPRTRVFIA